jgi:putative DeoR family transcriptional regulator (stage III sporulation protein D)
MRDYIENRTVQFAKYIIENNATVRETAKHFGISKSTVHKDIVERLQQVKPSMVNETMKVLMKNKTERHIRGGMSTKQKWEIKKYKGVIGQHGGIAIGKYLDFIRTHM